jgi:hypothetical protein
MRSMHHWLKNLNYDQPYNRRVRHSCPLAFICHADCNWLGVRMCRPQYLWNRLQTAFQHVPAPIPVEQTAGCISACAGPNTCGTDCRLHFSMCRPQYLWNRLQPAFQHVPAPIPVEQTADCISACADPNTCGTDCRLHFSMCRPQYLWNRRCVQAAGGQVVTRRLAATRNKVSLQTHNLLLGCSVV